MMNIEELSPTQDGYRLDKLVRRAMLEFILEGGVYDQETIQSHSGSNSLIAITRFPDGKLFIRDGLHRVTSIYIARADRVLYETEYVVEDMSYEMYLNPAPDKGWYTPFDPRTEVRLPDFFDFKSKVLEIQDIDEQVEYILAHKSDYAIERSILHTIEGLSALWRNGLHPVKGLSTLWN